MTKATKVVNYTEAQTVEMIVDYQLAENDAERKMVVDNLAEVMGKTVNSIRAKLSREKVYVKPTPTTKNGSAIVRKAKLVENIAQAMGKSSEEIESLEKATKTTLEAVLTALLKKQISDAGAEVDAETQS